MVLHSSMVTYWNHSAPAVNHKVIGTCIWDNEGHCYRLIAVRPFEARHLLLAEIDPLQRLDIVGQPRPISNEAPGAAKTSAPAPPRQPDQWSGGWSSSSMSRWRR